jgi:nicotinate-nucleotide pyrophosphorylase (carboxylating)
MKLNQADVLIDVKRALEEDVGKGDVSAALLPTVLRAEADIISREPMLVCGRPWVDAVFTEVNSAIKLDWLVKEGQWLDKPATLCQIKGPVAGILTAERSALNFLQTLSATATQTYQYRLRLQGSKTQLLDTRKTLPGLRRAQKYAVACAGGSNHRMGLYDAFLIKENHIKACGSITQAINQARQIRSDLLVEIEVETLEELREALLAKPDRILLDNFSSAMLIEAVAISTPYNCKLEASGGINLTTIAAVAKTGVDYVSIGAITKSIQAIDLSLLVRNVKCIYP